MQDLFSAQEAKLSPLADRMRPRTLDEFIGQAHIVGPGRLLRRAIEADRMTSSIFYGPPGCGKTTLASIIAGRTNAAFVDEDTAQRACHARGRHAPCPCNGPGLAGGARTRALGCPEKTTFWGAGQDRRRPAGAPSPKAATAANASRRTGRGMFFSIDWAVVIGQPAPP